MPKLPVLSGKDTIKALSKIGFRHVRTKGSHAILNKFDEVKGKITTLKNIMNQAGLTLDEFLELCK